MEINDIVTIKLDNRNYPAKIIYKDNANRTYTVYVPELDINVIIDNYGNVKGN